MHASSDASVLGFQATMVALDEAIYSITIDQLTMEAVEEYLPPLGPGSQTLVGRHAVSQIWHNGTRASQLAPSGAATLPADFSGGSAAVVLHYRLYM